MSRARLLKWLGAGTVAVLAAVAASVGYSAATASPPALPRSRLILAVPEFGVGFHDPLWAGWSSDAPRLRTLAHALTHAKPMGTVPTFPAVQAMMGDYVELGYSSGRAVSMTLDYADVVGISLPNGQWELLHSTFLAQIFRQPQPLFAYTPQDSAAAGPRGTM